MSLIVKRHASSLESIRSRHICCAMTFGERSPDAGELDNSREGFVFFSFVGHLSSFALSVTVTLLNNFTIKYYLTIGFLDCELCIYNIYGV